MRAPTPRPPRPDSFGPRGARWYNARVKAPTANHFELSSPEAVERFRKAAKAFTARSIKSQAAARKVLVDEGICTKSGKLTKRYS